MKAVAAWIGTWRRGQAARWFGGLAAVRPPLWVLALLVMVPGMRPAWSQAPSVIVRGGEHATFTRLALPLPDSVRWSLQQDGRRAILQMSVPGLRYDLAQAFDRIPRTRLQALRAEGAQLELRLVCDCPVIAVADPAGFLIIDIQDGPNPVVRNVLAPPGNDLAQFRPDTEMARAAGIALAQALRAAATDPQPVQQAPEGPLTDPPWPDIPTGSTHDGQSIDPGQQFVATALSLGTLSGVLTPAAASHTLAKGSVSDRAAAESVSPQGIQDHVRLPALGQWVETTSANQSGADCPHPALWQIASPMPDALMDDLDRVRAEAVQQAAQDYLARAMGAEARQLLDLLADQPEHDPPGRAWIRRLSYLVDLEPLPPGENWPASAECGADTVLWQVMARPGDVVLSQAQARSVVTTLAEFPPDLRLHLGPRLLRHFALSDAPDARLQLTRVLGRIAPPAGRVAALLTIADPDQSVGQGVWAVLLDRIQHQTQVDDLMIALHRAASQPGLLNAVLQNSAEDWLSLNRDDPARVSLQTLLALAQARSGQFDAALQTEQAIALDRASYPRSDLRARLADLVALEADDAVFLTTVFALSPWADSPILVSQRNGIATRLAMLGFVRQAQALDQPRSGQNPRSGTADMSGATGHLAHFPDDLVGKDPDAYAETAAASGTSVDAGFADATGQGDASVRDLESLPLSQTMATALAPSAYAPRRSIRAPARPAGLRTPDLSALRSPDPAQTEITLAGHVDEMTPAAALAQSASFLNDQVPPDGRATTLRTEQADPFWPMADRPKPMLRRMVPTASAAPSRLAAQDPAQDLAQDLAQGRALSGQAAMPAATTSELGQGTDLNGADSSSGLALASASGGLVGQDTVGAPNMARPATPETHADFDLGRDVPRQNAAGLSGTQGLDQQAQVAPAGADLPEAGQVAGASALEPAPSLEPAPASAPALDAAFASQVGGLFPQRDAPIATAQAPATLPALRMQDMAERPSQMVLPVDTELQTEDETGGPLARGRALLEASARLRLLTDDLLEP